MDTPKSINFHTLATRLYSETFKRINSGQHYNVDEEDGFCSCDSVVCTIQEFDDDDIQGRSKELFTENDDILNNRSVIVAILVGNVAENVSVSVG